MDFFKRYMRAQITTKYIQSAVYILSGSSRDFKVAQKWTSKNVLPTDTSMHVQSRRQVSQQIRARHRNTYIDGVHIHTGMVQLLVTGVHEIDLYFVPYLKIVKNRYK